MIRRFVFLGAMLLLSAAMPAQTADTTEVNELSAADTLEQTLPWPLDMQSRLDSLMRSPLLDYTQVGIAVWDLTDDRSLFSYNHRQLMRPASTMKLLTAITALDVLGGDYQFATSLYYNGTIEGRTLRGDLYCMGGMDPAFCTDDIKTFVDNLQQLGVDTITGTIFADVSMKDTLKWGEGWCWDDDNPVLSPLLVDRKPVFTAQLVNALVDRGIVLREVSVASGRLPEAAVMVAERKRSIDQILLRMMKDSDNLYAESVYFQIAAREKRPGKALFAQRMERALMERAGLKSGNYRLADGSGLSLYNYLSAECLLKLLRYAYKRERVYSHLLPALPVAGEDGTLKKRMKGTSAAGNVQAKTGTLTGIISLAGYCTARNGHRLCFAIINQGIQKGSDARAFQDVVCNIMCD